jgi:hypothetical protein
MYSCISVQGSLLLGEERGSEEMLQHLLLSFGIFPDFKNRISIEIQVIMGHYIIFTMTWTVIQDLGNSAQIPSTTKSPKSKYLVYDICWPIKTTVLAKLSVVLLYTWTRGV